MKLNILLTLALMLSVRSVHGQKIYLCDVNPVNRGYTELNSHSVNISNFSGYNKAVFSSDFVKVVNPVLVVSEKRDSLFHPVKWLKLEKKNQDEFYSSDVNWNEDGDFKLSVIAEQKEIASNYYSVNVNEDDDLIGLETDDDYRRYDDPNNTFYYIDSKVEFCETVNTDNQPVNLNTEFPIGNVAIYVTNNKPIISKDIKVSIYKLKGKDNQELLDEKYFPITSGDLNVSFKYYFGTKGSFLVSVYANEDIWVNDGNIKIK